MRELDHEDLVWFVLETFHRNLIHYGLWFREVEHQNGLQEALSADAAVFRTCMAYEMGEWARSWALRWTRTGCPCGSSR